MSFFSKFRRGCWTPFRFTPRPTTVFTLERPRKKKYFISYIIFTISTIIKCVCNTTRPRSSPPTYRHDKGLHLGRPMRYALRTWSLSMSLGWTLSAHDHWLFFSWSFFFDMSRASRTHATRQRRAFGDDEDDDYSIITDRNFGRLTRRNNTGKLPVRI